MRQTAKGTAAAITLVILILAALSCRPEAPIHTPTPAPEERATAKPRPQPRITPVCQRSEGVRTSLANLTEIQDCALITQGRLEQIPSTGNSPIFSKAYETGDLDGLINLYEAEITGGDLNHPAPGGLLRDMQALHSLRMVTAGDFPPGLLRGAGLLRRAYLANGYNSITPPDGGASAEAPLALTSLQEQLPPDLLCHTPWIAELHIWTPAVIPQGFFGCAPKLRLLEIGNITPDGQNAATEYVLDLTSLPFLTGLSAPATPGPGAGLRRVILSPESPLYQRMKPLAREGGADCPKYIARQNWIMCLDGE